MAPVIWLKKLREDGNRVPNFEKIRAAVAVNFCMITQPRLVGLCVDSGYY